MAEPKIKRLGFLDLPAELRIEIYRYALSTPALIVPARTDRFLRIPATVPARLLACCKTINNEARPIFFEVTDFVMGGPRDLLGLRAYVGRFAATITHLTFEYPSMINKTRIKELRAFKSLRTVNFGISVGRLVIHPNSISQEKLETSALETVHGKHSGDSAVAELVRQRPNLTYIIDVHAVQFVRSAARAGHAMSPAMLRNGVRFVGKIEIALAEDATDLVAKFVTLLRVEADETMVKVDVPAK